jgi:tetratricopeptide (TPR) repeat protein
MKRPAGRITALIPIGLILGLGFLAYGLALHGKFIWDDTLFVKNNPLITSWTSLPAFFQGVIAPPSEISTYFFRPLQMVSYTMDYHLGGLNPALFHATNIILHILTALAVYGLVRLLFGRKDIALLTAIFFVIFPLHAEAVAYIAGRADSLSTLFILLCLIFSVKQVSTKNKVLYPSMIASYALALCSKEYALVTPLLLPLVERAMGEKLWDRKFLRKLLPLAAISMIYILLRQTLLPSPPATSHAFGGVLQRLPGSLVAFTEYIRLLLWPTNLHMEYGFKTFSPYDPRAILGAALLAFVFYIAIRRRSDTIASFSTGWFLLALLPVSNIYPLNATMAEHWLYVPSIGFCLILAEALTALYKTNRWKRVGLVATVSLISIYLFLTVRQNEYWRDPIRFSEKTLTVAPQSWRLYNELGAEYAQNGENHRAVEAYKKALSINPSAVGIHRNLGDAYASLGKTREAIVSYATALAIKPNDAKTYDHLGNFWSRMGDPQKAIDAYAKAIALDPRQTKARYNLGVQLKNQGEIETAIKIFETTIARDPTYLPAVAALGDLYDRLGRKEKLEALYRWAVDKKVAYAAAYDFMGIQYSIQGDKKRAIAMHARALEIDPASPETCIRLGNVYCDIGRYNKAILLYEKALKIDPGLGMAHNNLAMATYAKGECDAARSHLQKAAALNFPIDPKLSALIQSCKK